MCSASGVFLAAVCSEAVILPSSSMRYRTRLRRVNAPSGLESGENLGPLTTPASSAASCNFKSVTGLQLQEAALLAGMVNGPKFSPLSNPDGALTRRNLVLHRMEDEGKITASEQTAAK